MNEQVNIDHLVDISRQIPTLMPWNIDLVRDWRGDWKVTYLEHTNAVLSATIGIYTILPEGIKAFIDTQPNLAEAIRLIHAAILIRLDEDGHDELHDIVWTYLKYKGGSHDYHLANKDYHQRTALDTHIKISSVNIKNDGWVNVCYTLNGVNGGPMVRTKHSLVDLIASRVIVGNTFDVGQYHKVHAERLMLRRNIRNYLRVCGNMNSKPLISKDSVYGKFIANILSQGTSAEGRHYKQHLYLADHNAREVRWAHHIQIH